MLRILVCVSGGGTNLQAVMDAIRDGRITNTEIVGVISNNKNAYALTGPGRAVLMPSAFHPGIFRTGRRSIRHFLIRWTPIVRI